MHLDNDIYLNNGHVTSRNQSQFPVTVSTGETFDGSGHLITVSDGFTFKGLFCLQGGTVRNCRIVVSNVDYQSLFTDSSWGNVENLTVSVTVPGQRVEGGLIAANAMINGDLTLRQIKLTLRCGEVNGALIGPRLAHACSENRRLTVENVNIKVTARQINGFVLGSDTATSVTSDCHLTLTFKNCWSRVYGQVPVDEFNQTYGGSIGTEFNTQCRYSIMSDNRGPKPRF